MIQGGAKLIATNLDPNCPTQNGGLRPGCGAMVGMLCGFVTEVYVCLWTHVPWTWYVMIGTVMTFGVGYGVSVMLRGWRFEP